MSRKYILVNTLTRHFIDFAKIMGFFSKIAHMYKDVCDLSYSIYLEKDNKYYLKKSYYDFINSSLTLYEKYYLSERFIKSRYFFGHVGFKEFTEEEIDCLTELFMLYLKDKKIIRYVRIDRS